MAHLGKKDLEAAHQGRSTSMPRSRAEVEKDGNPTVKRQFEVQDLELRGSLALLKAKRSKASRC